MTGEADIAYLREELFSISKELVSIGACFQELNSRFDEFMKAQEIKQNDHEIRLRKVEFTCLREEWWAKTWTNQEKIELRVITLENKGHSCKLETHFSNLLEKVESLRLFENRMLGSKQWEDRLWMIGQTIFILVVVAVVIWFMKGGSM